MINDEDLMKKIDDVCINYSGFAHDLYMIVGMVIVGRRLGWRVVRLTVSNALWTKGTNSFGDLKLLMPERTEYTRKSIGLSMVDKLGSYWDVIRGTVSVPMSDRRKLE